MKRKLITLLSTIVLASCSSENAATRNLDIKILAPTGAPSIGLYGFASEIETTSSPADALMPFFTQDVYDVLVAPTQGGLTKIIKQQANYKIAATITFGNFYLLSTGKDDDGILNAHDTVVIFQENDIPGKVFNYLYGDQELTVYAVPAANNTGQIINSGVYKISETETVDIDYVYTAEPIVTNLGKTDKIYANIRDVYSEKTGGKKIMQASVFVNNNSSKDKIDNFLSFLKSDVNKALSNPEFLRIGIESLGSEKEQEQVFGVKGSVAEAATRNNNGLGLGYLSAFEYQDDIQYFMNVLNPNFGDISEEVYYK